MPRAAMMHRFLDTFSICHIFAAIDFQLSPMLSLSFRCRCLYYATFLFDYAAFDPIDYVTPFRRLRFSLPMSFRC